MGDAMMWAWGGFGAAFLLLLLIDLFSHRGDREQSRKAAIVWTSIWIGAGLLFTFYVWAILGGQRAQTYLAAYFMEKTLSLDNLFVFLIIFESLKIPPRLQRTPLSWGIFGALVFRGIFIFAGAAALERWDWVSFVFAGLLLLAAIRTLRQDPTQEKENALVTWLARHLPVTSKIHDKKFIAHENGKRVITPLLLAIFALELTDILFAIDSVPAAFAVADSTFVIYSSNAFAILGLRSLYIVLADLLLRLTYLHYGLTAILIFAAAKIVAGNWIHIPALLSVGIIAGIIGISVWASLRKTRRDRKRDATS